MRCRWWVAKLTEEGYLRELPIRCADTRPVIPGHYRVTRELCLQLRYLSADYPEIAARSGMDDFRLKRSRFLSDIDPARVGISGATDYDHDVEAQRVVGMMLGSPRLAAEATIILEPRIILSSVGVGDGLKFVDGGSSSVFYQPDAMFTERSESTLWRSVVEYERYQTRKDAWAHIERFLGDLELHAYLGEHGVLRFVVDSEARVRSYKQLIEAFADFVMDHPEMRPKNEVLLCVSSQERMAKAQDPLDPRVWYRIQLAVRGSLAGGPVLHRQDGRGVSSPYDEYFARTGREEFDSLDSIFLSGDDRSDTDPGVMSSGDQSILGESSVDLMRDVQGGGE
jgi:hypothetical protein